jgi:hypothetical protein
MNFPSRHPQKRRLLFGYFLIYTPLVLLWETVPGIGYAKLFTIVSSLQFASSSGSLIHFTTRSIRRVFFRLGALLGISVYGISVRASSTRRTLLPDSISTTSTNISVCIIASLGLGAVLGILAHDDDVLLRRATRLHGSLMTNIRYRHVPPSSTYLHCEL